MGTVYLSAQQRELIKFMKYYTLRSTKERQLVKKSTNRLYAKIGLDNDVDLKESIRITQTVQDVEDVDEVEEGIGTFRPDDNEVDRALFDAIVV